MTWPTVALGDIFDIARGGSPRPIDDYITDDVGGLNWVMISDASASGKVIYQTKKRIRPEGLKKTRQVFPGDFILSNSMSFGRPYIMGTEGCIHDGWLLMRPKTEQFNADYFYHLLGSPDVYQSFASRAAGATVKNLNSDIVREVAVPLPPLEEQKRIAAILDQADALRLLRARALDRLDALGQAIFHEIFGDPVHDVASWNTDHRGGDWVRCALGNQLVLQRGKDITSKEARPGCVPVISSGGISFFHDEPLVKGPGVLLGRKGSVGKVHYTLDDFWPHDTTLYVKDFKGNVPVYVYYFFCQFPISRYEASAANPSLNRNNLHPVEVLWPPIELQRQFAEKIKMVDAQIKLSKSSLEQSRNLFSSLQHRAFSGKL